MQDRITINGEAYVRVALLGKAHARILDELVGIITTVRETEPKPAKPVQPVQQELPLAEPAKAPAPLLNSHMSEIVRQVRMRSVPTAALLSQKARIKHVDDKQHHVVIALGGPFVELFKRNQDKLTMVIDAAQLVFWDDTTVELVKDDDQVWQSEGAYLNRIYKDRRTTPFQRKVYEAWLKLEAECINKERSGFRFGDIQELSGGSKSGVHDAFTVIEHYGYVNSNNLVGRRKK